MEGCACEGEFWVAGSGEDGFFCTGPQAESGENPGQNIFFCYIYYSSACAIPPPLNKQKR